MPNGLLNLIPWIVMVIAGGGWWLKKQLAAHYARKAALIAMEQAAADKRTEALTALVLDSNKNAKSIEVGLMAFARQARDLIDKMASVVDGYGALNIEAVEVMKDHIASIKASAAETKDAPFVLKGMLRVAEGQMKEMLQLRVIIQKFSNLVAGPGGATGINPTDDDRERVFLEKQYLAGGADADSARDQAAEDLEKKMNSGGFPGV